MHNIARYSNFIDILAVSIPRSPPLKNAKLKTPTKGALPLKLYTVFGVLTVFKEVFYSEIFLKFKSP